MSNRLQSLDFLRGSCIIWMLFQHFTLWLANGNALPLLNLIVNIFDGFGSGAFLFVSGVGISLSHRRKMEKVTKKKTIIYKKLRLKYFLKAFLLLIVSFGFNLFIYFVVSNMDVTVIWIWFILQTLPISMIFAWPLLNINKYYKILSAIISLVLYQLLIILLFPFKAQYNHPLFILQFILFNGEHLSPFLGFFPFFIIGAFFGDIIYENLNIQTKNKSNSSVFTQKIISLLIIGISLIIAAILFIPPGIISGTSFMFSLRSISWLIYSVGVLITAYSLLLIIENSKVFKIQKKFRFIYYFSYYSLSIFLLHYIFDIFFAPFFEIWLVLIFWGVIVLGVGLGLKGIHKVIGKHFSLKYHLGKVTNLIAKYIYKDGTATSSINLQRIPVITPSKSQKKLI